MQLTKDFRLSMSFKVLFFCSVCPIEVSDVFKDIIKNLALLDNKKISLYIEKEVM